MQIIQAPRASAILYGLLVAQDSSRPWVLPANICPIVPITFLKAGIPFEFVDLSAASLQLDLDRAASLLATGRYGGLLYGHTYGEPSTPQAHFESIKQQRPDVFVIDDRCLCIPDLDAISTAADATLYSTGYAKIADLGFGGYAFLQDGRAYRQAHLASEPGTYAALEKHYKRALEHRTRFEYADSPWLDTESATPPWDEYRSRVQATGKVSLEGRARLNAIYSAGLPGGIQMPPQFQNWRFNLRVPNPSQMLQAIAAAGLFASAHYASLAGIMSDGKAPVAQALASQVLNLFNDHHFTPAMAERTCSLVRENLS
jgi:dTDP-4-amino-4,6-dideoxygalactose transaminase